MKGLTQDDVDLIDNKAAQIRRLSALIANVNDCVDDGWHSEAFTDDAQHALGDLAEIISENAKAITAAIAQTPITLKKGRAS